MSGGRTGQDGEGKHAPSSVLSPGVGSMAVFELIFRFAGLPQPTTAAQPT
jgi:hypothetical protein